MKYDFKKIEKKWQKIWAKNSYKVWHAEAVKDPASKRRGSPNEIGRQGLRIKDYVLDMFPYPSGAGLHVGHVEGYTASDIYARFLRMNGCNVLHPMGWDAFGLPAENYAIKMKIHPSLVVKRNIKRFKKQLNQLGLSYDWQREINTTDPEYYKWTQWIFLQLFKRGLAYEAEMPVNWCPSCKTVLANEEVAAGRCERCDSLAERRNLKQWLLSITSYADRLLEDLKGLDWPERVKEMQQNWIGRSEGRLIKFPIPNTQFSIEIFTTRPDTIDGATYMVLAPEHPIMPYLQNSIQNRKEAAAYIAAAENKSERDRIADTYEKTGVELQGVFAINPYNQKRVPVWISDYVLAQYGTGAIMAVPQHDERDRQFAEKFGLPIVSRPLVPKEKWLGESKVQYKLRDWIFSRQRYWGEPIPLVFCESCHKRLRGISNSQFPRQRRGSPMAAISKIKKEFNDGELLNPGWIAVAEEDLPVELPKVKKYQPTGRAESPLAGIAKWVNVKCPKCGGQAKRETNTMPQWAGSNWYYIGYVIARNLKSQIPISKQISNLKFQKPINYWLPVDIYVGGVEHAVLHLLYARFWHKFLYDIGVVSTKEPFQKLVNQGLILGPDGQKMSKSRGNVVNPDEMVQKFGADSLRLYEMFMGPLEDAKPWQPDGIIGLYRFLTRVYALNSKISAKGGSASGGKKQKSKLQVKIQNDLDRLLHKTIKKVTEDVKNFRFNTAISALMILLNEFEKNQAQLTNSLINQFTKLLFPFAPHLAQELWSLLGKKSLLDHEPWPAWDEKLAVEETFELLIQINGKLRAKVSAKRGLSEQEARKIALAHEAVKKWVGDKPVRKTIFVPDRLLNLVV